MDVDHVDKASSFVHNAVCKFGDSVEDFPLPKEGWQVPVEPVVPCESCE